MNDKNHHHTTRDTKSTVVKNEKANFKSIFFFCFGVFGLSTSNFFILKKILSQKFVGTVLAIIS
jgi:hypothetical protein